MTITTFTVEQNIFKDPHPPINVIALDENKLVSSHILQQFLATAGNNTIGLAPVYGTKCRLTTVAFSTSSQCIIVRFLSSKGKKQKKKRIANSLMPHLVRGRDLLQNEILCHPERRKYAFRMDKISASLYLDQNMRITDGTDLLSVSEEGRQSLAAVMDALGGVEILHRSEVIALVKYKEGIRTSLEHVALQAWAACRAGNLLSSQTNFVEIPRINTLSREEQV